jgi:hypothetical protein
MAAAGEGGRGDVGMEHALAGAVGGESAGEEAEAEGARHGRISAGKGSDAATQVAR